MSDQSQSDLTSLAIEAALCSSWEEAFKLNNRIIKSDPENIDALNRVARACFELGKIELSRKYYTMALKFDPYNPIATKNLKILKTFKASKIQRVNNYSAKISPYLFLEEPGKTKVVNLLKVAEPQKLSCVYPGLEVNIVCKNRGIIITDLSNAYLGVLPDDVAFNLLRLQRGGNKYQAIVKAVRVNALAVLIREIFRGSRYKNRPSFLDESDNVQSDSVHSAAFEDDRSDDSASEEWEEQP